MKSDELLRSKEVLGILGYTSKIGKIEKLPKINISSPAFRPTQIQIKHFRDVFGTYTETCITSEENEYALKTLQVSDWRIVLGMF